MSREPFDLDVHTIPARKGEPEHDHHDVRFLLLATGDERCVISDESIDLRWFALDEVASVTTEVSVLRMIEKSSQGIRMIRRDGGEVEKR